MQRTERTPQPRVPREAISWCIDDAAARAWTNAGIIAQKAHRIEVVTVHGRDYHKPICGASAVVHATERCEPAPEGFPACRNCFRKTVDAGKIPEVFLTP